MGWSTPFRLSSRIVLGLFCAGAITWTKGEAHATVMVPLSIEKLSDESDAVVRGRVVNDYSAWDDEHRRIYTFTEITVTEAILAPSAIGTSVVVRSIGGQVGEVGMHVSGTARFTLGEEVLLFLRRNPAGPVEYQVVGMSQGKYRMEVEAKGRVVAVADAQGIAYMRPGANRLMEAAPSEEERPTRIAYGDLKTRILAAVAERKKSQGAPATPVVPTQGNGGNPTLPTVPTVPSTPSTPADTISQ